MAKILIEINNLLLSEILIKSHSKGVSLDKFIEDIINSMVSETINTFLAEAITRAMKKNIGDEFKLEDLFEADEWAKLNGNTLGKHFSEQVKKGGLSNIFQRTNKGTFPSNYKRLA